MRFRRKGPIKPEDNWYSLSYWQTMANNSFMLKVDYEDIWKDVKQMDFGEVKPTNAHDRHTVQHITNVMKATRHAINHPEQAGISQERVQLYEERMQVMRNIWVEECQIASKVDAEVPVVQKDEEGTWRVYTQENSRQ